MPAIALLVGAAYFAAQVRGESPTTAETANRPNIVLIVADDLGYGDLGCYGAPDIRTPILDRLARDGVRFTSFYSNGPECSPTRTALMTGRYQHRVGGLECAIGTHNVGRYDDAIRLAEQGQLGLPVEEVALPRRLRDAGYACGLFGKWHLGYEDHFRPLRHGFEKSFGILGGNADYFRHTEDDGWPVLFEDDRPTTRTGYLTDLITDEALRWYARVKHRPFFLYLPFTAPHSPLQGPDDDTGELTPRDRWNTGPRTTYAAMVERMDLCIGRGVVALRSAHGPRRKIQRARRAHGRRRSPRISAERLGAGRRSPAIGGRKTCSRPLPPRDTIPIGGTSTMSLAPTLPEVFYPESDGKPMAETDIHWRLMVYIRQVLEWLYRGQKVYVGSNMLMYYVQGDPRRSVAPDDFVVKNCPPGNRRVFKTWEEGRVPNTVFEITSASTRSEDEHDKPEVYAGIGVKELFLVDPTLDYLDPPLQGYRFVKGAMRPILPDKTGALESKELGLKLRMEDGELGFYDARTGERLLTEAEAERQAREAERHARKQEHAARLAAEEEVRRLRAELERRPPAVD